MDFVGLLKALMEILVEYLKLKNKSFVYDILQKSRERQEKLKKDIEDARADGNDDRAQLVLRLFKEQKFYDDLSATYLEPIKRNGNTNP